MVINIFGSFITNKRSNHLLNIMAILLTFFIVFFIIGLSGSFAENQKTLVINDGNKTYDIAPYSYIIISDKNRLTPDKLVEKHKNNIGKKNIDTDIITVKDVKNTTHIIFTISNKTNIDRWILHFGNTLDGRIGMAKEISVLNYNTKQIVDFPSSDNNKNTKFLGSAISLKLLPNEKNVIIIDITAQRGLPLTFSPKLISQDNYIRTLIKGNIKNIIAGIVFFSIISFFLASFYITKNKTSKALISYYLVLLALFLNFDAYIVPIYIVDSLVLFWLYITSFTMLIMAGKFFSKMRYDLKPMENIALIMLATLIILSAFLYIFIFSGNLTGLIVMTSIISICLILLAVITFFTSEKPPYIVSIFCFALTLPGLALFLITSIMLGYVDVSYIQFFWYIHVVQAILFITAYIQSNIYRKQRKKEEAEYLVRDEKALYQLKKSKDSADKTRLLRVIERERELMSELREREIKRTEEMRVAKDMADKANQAKSAFLAVVSHEIRTPMNGILGMVQLLQSTNLSKTQSDYVDIIRKSGDSMMALLNDILDFEKIERGSMEVENVNFNIHKLVQDIAILMSGHAAQKNVELNTYIADNVPQIVSGDPTRLRQVILNLINNGLKFTDKGEVKINVTLAHDNENKIRFEIIDTGIGISKKAQKKLFTPFTQAETSTSRKYGGTGLGLAISFKLIEAMGGTIKVDSEEGKGSTFYFDLEMISRKAENINENEDIFFNSDKQEIKRKTKPMRILITEDNEMNRKVLEGLLIQQGHTLFIASNGLECIDICKREKPDLVLMDINMEGLSGIETTKRLRHDIDQDIASIPVIALTGDVMLEDIEEYFSNGMNGFIAKPIDSKQLEEVLYNASIGKFENDISKTDPSKKYDKLTQEQSDKTSKQNIDLTEVKTNLSFDDRDHYISDSEIKISDKSIINSPIEPQPNNNDSSNNKNDMAVSISDKPTNQKKSYKFNTPSHDDEMTEIQRYLMQQHSSHKSDNDSGDINAPKNLNEITKTEEDSAPYKNIEQANIQSPNIGFSDKVPTAPEINMNDLLDVEMLKSLVSTLGKEQFTNLMHGFLDKTTEIIDNIETAIKEDNIAVLGARAHELKGMSSNFGMKYISDLSAGIEKAAKTSQTDDALNNAKKLNAANDQTQTALKKWLADQQNIST